MPLADGKYIWTGHSRYKMRRYRLTESRVKRIIRHPARSEEGIVPGAVACMQPAESKKYSEIWTMYVLASPQAKRENPKSETRNPKQKQIKVITAWRYPGRAPERDPIPSRILSEIRSLI